MSATKTEKTITLELDVEQASLVGAALRTAAMQVPHRNFTGDTHYHLTQAARHYEMYMRLSCKLMAFCRELGVESHTYPNGKRTGE